MSENITAYAGDLINTEDMTIAENLERIIDAKSAIKDAIVSKGGQVAEDARIDQYPAAIEALPSGEDNLEKLLDGTITSVNYPHAPITNGKYKFADLKNIKTANVKIATNYPLCSHMFSNCTGLETVDISITTGSYSNDNAFEYIFQNCNNLKNINDIAIKSLQQQYLFQYAFQNCTSLVNPPEFPNFTGTYGHYCFQYAFQNCTSLVKTPHFEINNIHGINGWAFSHCFEGCTNLKEIDMKLERVFSTGNYTYMFSGCTSLTTAPELPSTTVDSSCYNHMFYGCTSLTTAPDLPATVLKYDCYSYMFYNCTSLQKTGNIAASGNISSYISNMFAGCTSLKEMTWTATTPPTISTSIWTNCPEDMIIYVPDESVDAYKAASVWSSRAAYIKGISEKPTE